MPWHALFSALAFVFVLEGLLPFLSPTLWRRSVHLLLQQSDASVRVMGFLSMRVGVLVMYLIRLCAGE